MQFFNFFPEGGYDDDNGGDVGGEDDMFAGEEGGLNQSLVTKFFRFTASYLKVNRLISLGYSGLGPSA